jgi:hypothetical protein
MRYSTHSRFSAGGLPPMGTNLTGILAANHIELCPHAFAVPWFQEKANDY